MIGYELLEGDYVAAGLDAAGSIPVIGDAIDLTRAAHDLNNAVDELIGIKEVEQEHEQAAPQFAKGLCGGTLTHSRKPQREDWSS
jgi:hypothetical protein